MSESLLHGNRDGMLKGTKHKRKVPKIKGSKRIPANSSEKATISRKNEIGSGSGIPIINATKRERITTSTTIVPSHTNANDSTDMSVLNDKLNKLKINNTNTNNNNNNSNIHTQTPQQTLQDKRQKALSSLPKTNATDKHTSIPLKTNPSLSTTSPQRKHASKLRAVTPIIQARAKTNETNLSEQQQSLKTSITITRGANNVTTNRTVHIQEQDTTITQKPTVDLKPKVTLHPNTKNISDLGDNQSDINDKNKMTMTIMLIKILILMK